jgi:hypothetical protein
MKAITNRLRVFAFGIVVAFLGLVNPAMALRCAHDALSIKLME